MKKSISIIIFACLSIVGLTAQQVVYNNAFPMDPTNPDVGLTTSTGSGCMGDDESVLQSTSLGMNTLGFGHQVAFPNSIADDFTLDQDCDLQTIMFYAYQTGSTTTSTITGSRVRIWDGDPTAGGTVIWGDLTTDVFASSTFSGIYRSTETSMGSCLRPIMAVETTVATTLPAGTYWLEWKMDGSLGSGPWAPPLTVLGTAVTGNGFQSLDDGVTFNPANDSSGDQQGFPFVITAATKDVEIVPTMGEWGVICLTIALLTFAIVAIREEKVSLT